MATRGWPSRTNQGCGHYVLRGNYVPIPLSSAGRTAHLSSFQRFHGGATKAVSGRSSRVNISHRYAFPSCLVIDLSLNLMEWPRVEPSPETSTLKISLSVELPDSLQPLHHNPELVRLGVFNYLLGDLMDSLCCSITLTSSIFGEKSLLDAPISLSSFSDLGSYRLVPLFDLSNFGDVHLFCPPLRITPCHVSLVHVDADMPARLNLLRILAKGNDYRGVSQGYRALFQTLIRKE